MQSPEFTFRNSKYKYFFTNIKCYFIKSNGKIVLNLLLQKIESRQIKKSVLHTPLLSVG